MRWLCALIKMKRQWLLVPGLTSPAVYLVYIVVYRRQTRDWINICVCLWEIRGSCCYGGFTVALADRVRCSIVLCGLGAVIMMDARPNGLDSFFLSYFLYSQKEKKKERDPSSRARQTQLPRRSARYKKARDIFLYSIIIKVKYFLQKRYAHATYCIKRCCSCCL